ncbi:MAG: hypothetical protein ABIF10_05585 [Candidatus Woesearchaeota archaeon]
MKKIMMYLFIICALAGLVSAALSVPTELLLGGDSQEKSNTNEDDFFIYTAPKTLSVQNNGNVSVDVVISHSIGSKYNVTFSPSSFSLAAGASRTVSVQAIVPEDLSTFYQSRSNPQDDRALTLGTVDFKQGTEVQQMTLKMQAENNLEFRKVYVSKDSGARKSFSNGDTVEEIKPGTKLTIEVIVKNAFSSSDNVDFDNVEVDIESDDSDFDVDENLDFTSVRAGNEKTKSYTYTVDKDIDEDIFSVEFLLNGEDDYGSIQGELWRIDFEIQREDEDISIQSATLQQETLSCDRNTVLNVRIENIGADDSDEVVLQWESTALGIKGEQLQIDLPEGEAYSRAIPLSIMSSQRAGTYPIRVITYFDFDRFGDRDINNYAEAQLTVQDCVEAITCYECIDSILLSSEYKAKTCPTGTFAVPPTCKKEESVKNVTVVAPPVTQPTTPAVSAPVTYRPARNDMLYIGLIVLGYIVVIIIGIALVGYIIRRR